MIYPNAAQQDRIIAGQECQQLLAIPLDPRSDMEATAPSPYVKCHQVTAKNINDMSLNDVSINHQRVKISPKAVNLPVTLVDDRDAPDGRCCIKIPWKYLIARPPPNFKAAYAEDSAITRKLSPEQRRL
ncbi:hypothetical protein Pmar_PMAR004995 [Perkinsus marinus ATCC 50983]|uniref:Uncharacterized protein n=1 Tax=Perkinsus marinus (strain ATCC 50983 / TXsc) TaxID=423536 RepID=C5LP66_PERM5|nr:hypothetical protein Pmar_PMAR004995 [Perkinsus marinus ATCC 50983]EER01477.1 hypothetical protein Pmar_PMAR004995 [Perkinsus marinus ATCC 50983]|eukprot:XP_002768759.1 hypothetical protein Pmar_PMAR004995 [Perkinsus marinus ATCC 50983]